MESLKPSPRGGTCSASPRTLTPPKAGGLVVALVLALIALAGTSSPRHSATRPVTAGSGQRLGSGASGREGYVLVDSPGTSGLVNLGDLTVGLDRSSVSADLSAPGGPQLKPDIACGVEPGAAVDGIAVPLLKGLTQGTGDVAVRTPSIGSMKSIGVDLGGHGRITATVHQYEGLL